MKLLYLFLAIAHFMGMSMAASNKRWVVYLTG